MYVLIGLLVLLIIILFAPVKLQVIKENKTQISVKYLFFKIPVEPNKKQKPPKDSQTKRKPQKKKIGFVDNIKKILALKEDISAFIDYVSSRCIKIEDLQFCLDFGTGNAATTGILNGTINGFVYALVGIIHQNTLLKKWTVNITPYYEEVKFSYLIKCILTTRPIHIIGIGAKGLKLYLKYKKL